LVNNSGFFEGSQFLCLHSQAFQEQQPFKMVYIIQVCVIRVMRGQRGWWATGVVCGASIIGWDICSTGWKFRMKVGGGRVVNGWCCEMQKLCTLMGTHSIHTHHIHPQHFRVLIIQHYSPTHLQNIVVYRNVHSGHQPALQISQPALGYYWIGDMWQIPVACQLLGRNNMERRVSSSLSFNPSQGNIICYYL
jgi:hypothetical protein